MPGPGLETLHASCVAIGSRAVLLEGISGSGKSQLALRLIDRGATLVSDDYTDVWAESDVLLAAPPERLRGLIEVRGIGIVALPHQGRARVELIVALDKGEPRMPEEEARPVAGIELPYLRLSPHDPTTAIKVELALAGRTVS